MAAPVVSKTPVVRAKKARRRIIVNRGFQFRALLPILVFVGLLAVLTLSFVFLPINRGVASDPDPAVQALLGSQLLRIELWLVPLLILSASLAGIVALVLSQRVAGPMRRLHDGLAKLATGTPEPLKFRRKDEFREMEEVFAGVVSRVEDLTKHKLELLNLLRRNLEGIAHRAGTEQFNPAELRESLAVVLRDLDDEIKKLKMKS